MKITIRTGQQEPEVIVLPLTAGDQRGEVFETVARQLEMPAEQLRRDFSAEPGEILPVYLPGNRRRLLLGLGEKPGFSEVLKAFRSLAHKFRQKLPPVLGVDFRHHSQPAEVLSWIEAAANGLHLGTYLLGRFKTTPAEAHPLAADDAELVLLLGSSLQNGALEAAGRGLIIAETQLSVYDLVNAPSNKKTPDDLAEWTRRSGTRYGYSTRILGKAEIEEAGLHALLAVNQGSALPPAFIILEYRPELPAQTTVKKIGLVGKGVTFDTGGLSIKPSANMHLMKSDMGGAAAVFGALEAAARLQLPIHLVGIVPATENSVDANSVKPSDVIGSYSGKTIEVIDTDAEGRLILADGLSYMVRQHHPELLIDLATLTGATVRTLGYHAAGLFSNNDELAEQLYRIGQRTGERLWRLPLWDVYKEDLKSDVADVRNFSGRPVAGAIAAAKFLEVFTDEHPAWAHLDIAGVAFNDSEFANQKSATAFGIRLLVEFFEDVIRMT